MNWEDLVEEAQRHLATDPCWTASAEYRSLVETFLAARAPIAEVRWLAPGSRSYREGTVLGLETLTPARGVEGVREHGLVVLHELLHFAHSDHRGAETFQAELAHFKRPFLIRLGLDVFNHLEDARVAARELELEPAHGPFITELHRVAIEQEQAQHERQIGELPWTTSPRHRFAQLRLALVVRLLMHTRPAPLDRVVDEVMESVEPTLLLGIAAPTTEGARSAAVATIDHIADRWSELTTDLEGAPIVALAFVDEHGPLERGHGRGAPDLPGLVCA